MIEIQSLCKDYKSKRRGCCRALDNVNLTLPDTGLVFVLGKSGSGKSTLLNLIGGLDSITEGKIVVDGNDLSSFKEVDFCNYRNTHLGFIFQDYHLLDELTVYENIVLSLRLHRMDDEEKVKEALEKVDLAGYEERYPGELSGGERQRVAIARALVKNPRIILADEPTGNLDKVTATSITRLLQDISKDCLILVVSHNMEDAHTYADRIIELAKGRIISDHSRNPEFCNEVTAVADTLVYPEGSALSDADIQLINEMPNRKLVRKSDKYIPTKVKEFFSKRISIENKNLSFADRAKLSRIFLKSKAWIISLSSFMVAVIMVILSLAQTIINFDAEKIISGELQKTSVDSLFCMKMGGDDGSASGGGKYHVAIGEQDIHYFQQAGYGGNIYPIYNVTVPVTIYKNQYGYAQNNISNKGFMTETLGTMIVDDAFLTAKFGEVEFLAQRNVYDPAGLIITDYVADSILATNSKYKGKTYEDIIGKYFCQGCESVNITVNAIISTGYRERYEALFERIKANAYSSTAALHNDAEFLELYNEIHEKLGFSYSTNRDFVEDYVQNVPVHYAVALQRMMINNLVRIGNEDSSSYIMIPGRQSDSTVASGLYYTTQNPIIPVNAKYVRVSYGMSANGLKTDTYRNSIVALKEYTHLVFSNGYVASREEILHTEGVYLSKNGVVEPQTGSTYSAVSDYIEIPKGATIDEFCTFSVNKSAFYAFYDEGKNFICATQSGTSAMPTASIQMNYSHYNDIFGTQYTSKDFSSFIPHKVTLTQYRLADENCTTPLASMEVTVIGLTTKETSASLDVLSAFTQTDVYYNALYFDGLDNVEAVLDLAEHLGYAYKSISVEAIHTMTTAVDVFVPIFRLVAIFLCIGVIFILVNFSSKMINSKMHDIGILKALGTKNTAVGMVFGFQVLLIAILTCLMATVGYYFFIGVANDVLVESLKKLAPSRVMFDMDFLTFQGGIAIENCLLVFFLSAISLVLPMIKIKNIKPVKIIKTKE